MKHLRSILAWTFYWLGDTVSHLDYFEHPEWLVYLWYPIYNWFMLMSLYIQGETDCGPWGKD